MKRIDEMKVRNIEGYALVKDYTMSSGKVLKAGRIVQFDKELAIKLYEEGIIKKPSWIEGKNQKTK